MDQLAFLKRCCALKPDWAPVTVYGALSLGVLEGEVIEDYYQADDDEVIGLLADYQSATVEELEAAITSRGYFR